MSGADSQRRPAAAPAAASRGLRGPGGRHGFHIESPKDFRQAVKRLGGYLRGQWPLLAVVGLAIAAGAVLQALVPARLGLAIRDHIERHPDAARFLAQMLRVLALAVGAWAANALSGLLLIRAGNAVIYRMRRETFAHIQQLPMDYFDARGIGDTISRVTNDIEMIYNAMVNGFPGLLRGLFSIVGTLIAMLVLNVPLSLVVLAVMPLMFLTTALIGRRVRRAFRDNQAQVGRLSGAIEESVTALKVIQAFHRQAESDRRFEEVNREATRVGGKAETAAFAINPILRFMNGFTLALLVGIGGMLILRRSGVFTIGLLTSFILYARNFFEPLREMTDVYNLVQSALAGVERVFEILNAPTETSPPDAVRLPDIRGEVEFRRVSFGYLPDQVVLEDVSLTARPGQSIAIVGPTGAGKTTLVNLLSRFYDVRSGSILVDGVDIRRLDLATLRTRMGVVLQEPYFFATSIRENILYGNPQAGEERMLQAARLARADAFIRRLPQGYDTVLQERGANLSQGERQLLAIARAILADPRILVLDEATSSVDSLTELLIQKGLLELLKGRTSFIIAHRLSTIRNADQLVVLHNHRVVERGTHDELLRAGGFYARLYAMQFQRPEITEEMEI